MKIKYSGEAHRCILFEEKQPSFRLITLFFDNAFNAFSVTPQFTLYVLYEHYILSTVSIPSNANALFITPQAASVIASLAFFTSTGTSLFKIGFEL